MSPRNIARDTKLGIPGFHVFRRFRLTNLREAAVAEDIIRFWMGHADKSITDRYSMMNGAWQSEKNGQRKWVFASNCLHLYPAYPSRRK